MFDCRGESIVKIIWKILAAIGAVLAAIGIILFGKKFFPRIGTVKGGGQPFVMGPGDTIIVTTPTGKVDVPLPRTDNGVQVKYGDVQAVQVTEGQATVSVKHPLRG
jgi:hypothetical protein